MKTRVEHKVNRKLKKNVFTKNLFEQQFAPGVPSSLDKSLSWKRKFLDTYVHTFQSKLNVKKMHVTDGMGLTAWIGGSLLGSLIAGPSIFLDREEYDVGGPGSIHKKTWF